MSNYFDYTDEKYQKGYTEISKNKDSLKQAIGKTIAYLKTRDYDRYRGYMVVKYGILTKIYRNILIINDYNDEVDIKDILEIAVKNE